MYTYSIVALCIIVIIFISVRCNNKEGYSDYEDSPSPSISDSPASYSQIPSTSPLAQSLNSASNNLDLYTANNINYNVLDTNIQYIERQFAEMQYILKNLKFTIGAVYTSGSSTADEPSITIGGNYPDNIQLNFKLLPPKPGVTGDQGVPGEQGIPGEQGKKGIRGPIGGNSFS
jgi:hypothetical protein